MSEKFIQIVKSFSSWIIVLPGTELTSTLLHDSSTVNMHCHAICASNILQNVNHFKRLQYTLQYECEHQTTNYKFFKYLQETINMKLLKIYLQLIDNS